MLMNEDFYFDKFQADTEEAYVAFNDYVCRSLLQLGRNLLGPDQKEEIQIIVADAIYKAYERRSSFHKIEEVRLWLRVAVKNACIKWLEHDKVKNRYKLYVLSRHNEGRDALDSENDLDFERALLHLRKLVLREIENLPPRQKAVIQLYREGHKNQAIAEKLGMSEKTVRNTKTDAINNLRKNLDIGPETILAVLAAILTVNDNTPV